MAIIGHRMRGEREEPSCSSAANESGQTTHTLGLPMRQAQASEDMRRSRFNAIMQDHRDRLYSSAVYLLGNTAEAEEVVQDVFIKLWQREEAMDPTHTRAWLLRVTRNACLDLIRKRAHQRQYALAANDDGNVVTLYTQSFLDFYK